MRAVRYYFNVSFDRQGKKYDCILMNDKKPVCGISGDFEAVRSWVNRKRKYFKQCGSTVTTIYGGIL